MTGPKPSEQVEFKPKPAWAKKDCINNSAGRRCDNPATLVAATEHNTVRCCIEEICKDKAAEIALAAEDFFNKKQQS